MAKRAAKVSISVAMAGDITDRAIGAAFFGALDRHGLAPQKISTIEEDRIAVTSADVFVDGWLVEQQLMNPDDSLRTARFGPDWSRQNAPQGWGSVYHRLVDIYGKAKLARISAGYTFSPRVDWKAAFVDICTALTPISATLNVFRPIGSELGFVEAYPLFATDTAYRSEPLDQADETTWGTMPRVPWGVWMGDLWEPERRAALAAEVIESGNLLHLTDAVPRDPDILNAERERLFAALPQVFNPRPRYRGLP